MLMFMPSHFSCRPCVRIAPAFNMLSNKYPQVVFLEVDVHVCQVCKKEKHLKVSDTDTHLLSGEFLVLEKDFFCPFPTSMI